MPDMNILKVLLAVIWMLSSDTESDEFYASMTDIHLGEWYDMIRTCNDYSLSSDLADIPEEESRPGEKKRGHLWKMLAICVNWTAMDTDQQSATYANMRALLAHARYADTLLSLLAHARYAEVSGTTTQRRGIRDNPKQ